MKNLNTVLITIGLAAGVICMLIQDARIESLEKQMKKDTDDLIDSIKLNAKSWDEPLD